MLSIRILKRISLLFLVISVFLIKNSFSQESGEWKIKKSTHFIVYFRNSGEKFVDELIRESEDCYNRIADNLGFRRSDFWLWEDRAKIYVYDSAEEFQEETNMPSWSAGAAASARKTIHTYPYERGFLQTILPHELGHIIFREFVGVNNFAVPLWLEEGVASYQEKSRYDFADRYVLEAKENKTFLTIEELSAYNPNLYNDEDSARLFYSEAFSIVNFLIKKFGRDRFVFFCQNLRDKKNLDRAVSASYPFNGISDLGRAWEKYLKNE